MRGRSGRTGATAHILLVITRVPSGAWCLDGRRIGSGPAGRRVMFASDEVSIALLSEAGRTSDVRAEVRRRRGRGRQVLVYGFARTTSRRTCRGRRLRGPDRSEAGVGSPGPEPGPEVLIAGGLRHRSRTSTSSRGSPGCRPVRGGVPAQGWLRPSAAYGQEPGGDCAVIVTRSRTDG